MDYTKLPFPHNIYAKALLLAEGSVQALHYGFNPQQDNLQLAQHRATKYLIQQLPKPPAKVLEVNADLGYAASQVIKEGYEYTGLAVDEIQLVHCESLQLRGRFMNTPFLDHWVEIPYDVIFFQEASQKRISATSRLQHAWQLLGAKGYLLILDEIETNKLSELLQLAEQTGFAIVKQEDLSAQAAPTLDYLVDLLYDYRKELLQKLSLSSVKLTEVIYMLEMRRQHYLQKNYAYMFFKLQRNAL